MSWPESGHHLVNHEIEEWWVLVGTRGPELLSETAPAVVPPPRPLPPTENRKNVYPNTPHLIVARLAPATSYESSGHPRTWMQQVCDVQLGGHRFPGTPRPWLHPQRRSQESLSFHSRNRQI